MKVIKIEIITNEEEKRIPISTYVKQMREEMEKINKKGEPKNEKK